MKYPITGPDIQDFSPMLKFIIGIRKKNTPTIDSNKVAGHARPKNEICTDTHFRRTSNSDVWLALKLNSSGIFDTIWPQGHVSFQVRKEILNVIEYRENI